MSVYPCSWKELSGKYRLWVISNPKLSVSSQDFEDASEELSEKIGDVTGNREVVLEFQPPPPSANDLADWLTPKLLSLGYDEDAKSNIRDAQMFEGGFCSLCGSSKGPRTEKPLTIAQTIKGDIAVLRDSPQVRIYSENLLGLLHESQRRLFQFQAVIGGGLRKKFFEIVAGPSLAPVSFKDAEYHPITNWQCPKCGRRYLNPYHPRFFGLGIQFYVSSDDLPNPLPDCFLLGSAEDGLAICFSDLKWSILIGKPGTTGVVTHPVGVVKSEWVVRKPPLKRLPS